jgi:hypothetical protein
MLGSDESYFGMECQMEKSCMNCDFAKREVDRFDDLKLECCRFPPKEIRGSALSKFPRVLEDWACGEWRKLETD